MNARLTMPMKQCKLCGKNNVLFQSAASKVCISCNANLEIGREKRRIAKDARRPESEARRIKLEAHRKAKEANDERLYRVRTEWLAARDADELNKKKGLPNLSLILREIFVATDGMSADRATSTALGMIAGLTLVFPNEGEINKYLRSQRIIAELKRDPTLRTTRRLAENHGIDVRQVTILRKRELAKPCPISA